MHTTGKVNGWCVVLFTQIVPRVTVITNRFEPHSVRNVTKSVHRALAVWIGGHAVWIGGHAVWIGGHVVWIGGHVVWIGGHVVWIGGHVVWIGGHVVWIGGHVVWIGGHVVWIGGHVVWIGGHVVWFGGDPAAASVNTTHTMQHKKHVTRHVCFQG